MKRITQKYLQSILHYNPETGKWIWVRSKGSQKAGNPAGCLDQGYYTIRIKRHNYISSRVAFLYMKGRWPKEVMDHKNGVTTDDRWENLREATRGQNQQNHKRNSRNKSGYKGVQWMPRCKNFRARIRVRGELIQIGTFPTPELAHAAYVAAAKKHFGEFARAA
jgi:HNH endonuclease